MISPDIAQTIEKAKQELRGKTIYQIQVETARAWAGRACAAAMFSDEAASTGSNPNDTLTWMLNAVEYGHEALEHAALSGNAQLIAEVQSALNACGVKTA